jgi:hypothetical protein
LAGSPDCKSGSSDIRVRVPSLPLWNGQRAAKVLHTTVSPVGSLQGDIDVTKVVEYRSKNSDNT